MSVAWKSNWPETRQHFIDWWNHSGLVVGAWGGPSLNGPSRDLRPCPPEPATPEAAYTDVPSRAMRKHLRLAGTCFEADTLPLADTCIGPGSLALLLGSEPGFSWHTVWFEPAFRDHPHPEELPPLRFDPANRWWRLHEETLRAHVALGRGLYFTACPDLIENIDILASLRDAQTLLVDMIERPEWVRRAVNEINQVWFEAYNRVYDIIRDEEGGAAYGAFCFWGPGRTAKVQCDACAMFSPEMFRDFVQPALTAQCDGLDYSVYHLDGTQAVCHLDALLEIPSLDAIEWTPQAGIEGGDHSRWFPMYKRILDAGKSVQIMAGGVDSIEPILKAIGSRGVYLMCGFRTADEAKQAARIADKWRH